MPAIVIAIVLALLIAGVAAFLIVRTSRQRGESPGDTPPDRPRGRPAAPPPKEEPSDADLQGIVREAEAILESQSSDVTGEEEGVSEAEGPVDEDSSPVAVLDVEEALPEKPTFRDRLSRTRKAMADRIGDIRLRRKIDDDLWDDLEETLILADVGVEVALELVDAARDRARDEKAETSGDVIESLKVVMTDRLSAKDRHLERSPDGPSMWVMVGVNGTGKTTTIGKIATTSARSGDHCVLAAADTFRAAAADQLAIWAERSGAELIRGQEGADPGSVVFDAVARTNATKADLLLVDTAGRLHTKVGLMDELGKIFRVAEKAGGTPDEVLLVLDATTGQNGLVQAREFAAAASVTGVVLTKLDGTAKGGIAFAIEQDFGIPIKLVGLGEGQDDLVVFDPREFVDALFS